MPPFQRFNVSLTDVNQATIKAGLHELGLRNQDMAVHSSLTSFGYVTGGAQAVIQASLDVCGTVLMPTFCEIGRTNPPPEDRPDQNGWDYEAYRVDTTDIAPFDPNAFDKTTGLNVSEMGRIPAEFLRLDGTVRSKHPSVSWAASGPDAEWYVAGHGANDPNLPLKRLRQRQGLVLLLGVDLAGCTAVHLAEEMAGRRPFIRWILHADGIVRRVREYECSDAFPKLAPHVEQLARHVDLGPCRAVCYSIDKLVSAIVQVLKAEPEITLCGRTTLCRCQHSVKGGPIEHGEANTRGNPSELRPLGCLSSNVR